MGKQKRVKDHAASALCCQSSFWYCSRMTTKNTEKAGLWRARNRVACKGDRKRVAAVVVFMHGMSSNTRPTMAADNSKERCGCVLLLGREAAPVCNPLRVTCATARPMTQGRQRRTALGGVSQGRTWTGLGTRNSPEVERRVECVDTGGHGALLRTK